MKVFTLVFVLLAIGYSQAIPTWGLMSIPPQRGPGWSDNAAASLYPAAIASPYGGYGYAAASSPVYFGSYSQSPNFPGYTPGLYGLGYLNLRG